MAAAAELCYRTVNCSALNAEQLRREGGLEALRDAIDRCVSVLSSSTKSNALPAMVSENICRCFGTAAQFSACREKLSQLPSITNDVVRILHFSVNDLMKYFSNSFSFHFNFRHLYFYDMFGFSPFTFGFSIIM